MPEVSSLVVGNFCWPELSTSDPAAAKAFYGSLFGWSAEDTPAGPDMVYTMLRLRGLEVGALYQMSKGESAAGVPPHWNSYVGVASADDAARKAKELGGTLLMEPFDVMDVGRMAIVTDPTGATFCLWQAKKHFGARLMGEDGTLCWTELWTRDVPKAKAFYTGLFGWVAKESSTAGMNYTEWANQGREIGGMMALTPDMAQVPPHWMPYIMVADCDATAGKAKDAGATLIVPPHDIPNVGRFSVIADPQRAVFSIITLAHAGK